MDFPFELPSHETIARELHEREAQSYEAETQLVYDTTKKQYGLADGTLIKVTKNDNINRKVGHIVSALQRDQHVLIAGKASGISKLVSVVEIVKRTLEKKVYQSNKLTKTQSPTNPNYPLAKQTQPQKESSVQFVSEQTRQEIRTGGVKVYDLPVLYVLLTTKEVERHDGWTSQ